MAVVIGQHSRNLDDGPIERSSAQRGSVEGVSADTFTEHRVVIDDGPARARAWREAFGEPAGELYLWRNPAPDREPAFLHAPVFELPLPGGGWVYELVRIDDSDGRRVAYYRMQDEPPAA
jgi:hypothetical protein